MAPSEVISDAAPQDVLLNLSGVETGYGRKQVLFGVDLSLRKGEAIALLGHNGAGKTTLLQTVFGLQPPWKGDLVFDGATLGPGHSSAQAVALGMAMIPAERFVFPDLTVTENLRISARGLTAEKRDERMQAAYEDFPILKDCSGQLAGTMSGGQQRMVSLAMALMREPRLLLLDEPSLGLSPAIAEQIMERVSALIEQGVSVVLVEQNIAAALKVATRVFILRGGELILEEDATTFEARGRETWWDLF